VKLCSVVKAELLSGAYKSQNSVRTIQNLADFFSEFDDSAAEAYGRIRSELEKRGTPIGGDDLLIAAIAIANNATLVTNNTREFSRVPGLRWESWEPAIM
jgi:tRNA(fMet)-specific endonuclease VapC